MKSEPDEHDNSPVCRQTEQRIKVICEDKTFIFWKNDLIKASAFFAEKVKNSTELRLVDRKDRVKTFQEFVEAQLASVPASNSFSTSLHDKHLICGDGCRYQFSYDAVWRDIDIYTFGTKYGISSLANYYLARLRCRLWIIHKYRTGLLCDIASYHSDPRSNPSRLQAVREYPKADAEILIQLFGCLDHTNILSSRDCYIDANPIYVFVDDFPLTLRNVVSSPHIYTELELAAIMSQISLIVSISVDKLTDKIVDGLCYLSSFGLTQSITVVWWNTARHKWQSNDWLVLGSYE